MKPLQSQPSGRAFKYQFDLQIQRIKVLKPIEIPKGSHLQIIWRRGQKNIATKAKPEIKGSQEEVWFRETLSMVSTCFLSYESGQFNTKQSVVSVVIYIDGIQKLFGLNPKNYQQRGMKLLEEELNGRAKSRIVLKLTSSYINQMVRNQEQLSIGSGIHSNSYNNNSNNNNGGSGSVNVGWNVGSVGGSGGERRVVSGGVGGIPSKDTYSVVSYGVVGRYSGRKDDVISLRKQESGKKIQEQPSKDYSNYGYPPHTTNYYTKSSNQYNLIRGGGISGGITNIQGIPSSSSIQSSINRNNRNSDSNEQSKLMGNNDQNSRLLVVEQNKRSKLEAEVTKHRVENDELKNKLTEYVRQNMKLKQQLKRSTNDNTDSRASETRKQLEQFKDRNCILTAEAKQLKIRLQKYTNLQRECFTVKTERDGMARQMRQYEQSLGAMRVQMEQLRKNLTKVRESQAKLYSELRDVKVSRNENEQNKKIQYQNRMREVSGQLEYYQNSAKNLGILLRECQEKYRVLEVKVKSSDGSQNTKFQQTIVSKNKEISELNDKFQNKQQQCTRYVLQLQKMKNQMTKYREERNNEMETNRNRLTGEIEKLSTALRDANQKVVLGQQEKILMSGQIKSQALGRVKEVERVRELEESIREREKKVLLEQSELKNIITALQHQNSQLRQKSSSIEQLQANREQVDHLLKQNLQLELQLKYKTQQMSKYHSMQQQLGRIRCKLQIMQKNAKEVSQQLEKCQRDSKEKNKMYVIQCQKGRMMTEERNNAVKIHSSLRQSCQQMRIELQRKDKQMKEMKESMGELERKNRSTGQEVKLLQGQLGRINHEKLTSEIRNLDTRNKELEVRNSQKIKTIENLHKSVAEASVEIKQLQLLSEQRYQQLIQKDHLIAELESQFLQMQNLKASVCQDLTLSTNEKKSLMKKNEVLMQELFNYKKKFEEEKGRSNTSVYVRSSEQYVKIKNLENELQKKEMIIGKMEKEMMVLQNQNINLNIEVMKKLEGGREDDGVGK